MSEAILKKLLGRWQGTCRTWFQPDELADESAIEGTITLLFGSIAVHRYQATLQGKHRNGEEFLSFNSVTQLFETAWIDSFHMNYGIMQSTGPVDARGFSVTGHYAVGDGEPDWGWRTEFEPKNDRLAIVSYNIAPTGQEAKAVETIYARVTAAPA